MAFDIVTYALLKKSTSNEINKILESLAEGMKFKGEVATWADLPENPKNGDLYIISQENKKAVYDGTKWIAFDAKPTKISELENDENYIKADGVTPTIKVAAGTNIGAVGTPSVTAATSGNTTTFTFDYLKGARGPKGDKGDTGPQGPKGDKGESNKSEVEALGKRIDNLILSSGTESSAEVVDARNGYDGTTYDTLGTAIRSQVSELKDDLDELYQTVGKKFIGVFDGHSANINYKLISGQTYYLYYVKGSVCNFYASTDTSKSVTITEGNSYTFTPNKTGNIALFRNVVSGSNDFIISLSTNESFLLNDKNNLELKQKTNNLIEYSKYNNLFEPYTENTAINHKGNVATANGWCTSGLIPVDSIFYLNGGIGAVQLPWLSIAYYDKEKNLISGETLGETTFNHNSKTVPEGTRYLRICSTMKKQTGDNPLFVSVRTMDIIKAEESEYIEHFDFKKRLKDKVITFIGDSITEGYTEEGDTVTFVEKPFPKVVSELLGCTVQNLGASGTRVSSYNGTQQNSFTSRVNSIRSDADIVFVMGGINDYFYPEQGQTLGTINDETDISYYGGLFTLINLIKTKLPNCELFIATPTHMYDESAKPNGGKPYSDYIKAVKDICQKMSVKCIDVYGESGISYSVTQVRSSCYSGGIHLTQNGYTELGKFIANKLLKEASQLN